MAPPLDPLQFVYTAVYVIFERKSSFTLSTPRSINVASNAWLAKLNHSIIRKPNRLEIFQSRDSTCLVFSKSIDQRIDFNSASILSFRPLLWELSNPLPYFTKIIIRTKFGTIDNNLKISPSPPQKKNIWTYHIH